MTCRSDIIASTMGRATCVVCGATFSRAMSLRRHALLHATSKERIKHQCHTCGRTFARADGLARHINIHTGNDLEHCEDCGRGFGRGYLDAHIRTCRGHFMRRQDERAGIQPAQNANNVQILDWRIERRKGEELLPQTKTPGLMKPVQFVHETVGSLTTLCKNAKRIVRKNDLKALEELLGCLVLRYATVETSSSCTTSKLRNGRIVRDQFPCWTSPQTRERWKCFDIYHHLGRSSRVYRMDKQYCIEL